MASEQQTILVVDDEDYICKFLKDYLDAHGYVVFTANDGEGMRKALASEDIDLVILDLVMPGEDGLTLTRSLREKSNVAIIILTGKDEEVDRIVGLEMGADDYVAKPFSSRELLARVKTVLRRTGEATQTAADTASATRFAGWRLDKVGRTLTSPDENDIPLTTMELIFSTPSPTIRTRCSTATNSSTWCSTGIGSLTTAASMSWSGGCATKLKPIHKSPS